MPGAAVETRGAEAMPPHCPGDASMHGVLLCGAPPMNMAPGAVLPWGGAGGIGAPPDGEAPGERPKAGAPVGPCGGSADIAVGAGAATLPRAPGDAEAPGSGPEAAGSEAPAPGAAGTPAPGKVSGFSNTRGPDFKLFTSPCCMHHP